MTLAETLKELIVELDRVHPGGHVEVAKLDRGILPTWVTAATGEERHFTNAALRALLVITDVLFKGVAGLSQRVSVEEYSQIVRQAVADCHAAGEFDLARHAVDTCKSSLKKRIDEAAKNLQTAFTHYFSAWTLGAERSQRFAVGPVRFLTREEWVESVRFHDSAVRAFSPKKGRRFHWRKRLRALLQGKARISKTKTLPDWLYQAIKDCPAVLKVKVVGSERSLSRQRARYACRTALDCVALLFDDADGERHRQFVLAEERLTPIGESTLIETRGNLWLPGSSFHPRGWMGDPDTPATIVRSLAAKNLLGASGEVIKTLLNPKSNRHAQLAQRWATALSIYAEGCREVQDGLALAKLAASLDILSGGGMDKGILAMLLHQSGQAPTDVVVKLPQPQTLKQVVERIYNYGRSQFLHGNHVDPMKRFKVERQYATYLARGALRNSVLRLSKYRGPDNDKAFQSM